MQTLIRFLGVVASIALACVVMNRSVGAVQTKVVQTDTYQELAPGKFRSVSLSHDGRLTLAPDLKSLYRIDAEMVWGMAVAPDGRVFYGTGHDGKIFCTDRKGNGTLYLDTDSPEVTALLFHRDALYVATAPDGNLWVCDKPGTLTLVYATEQKYVWDLLADPKGDIIAATGPEGKIFKVDPKKKKGELLFDAPDEHVLSLALDLKGRLHASTQGAGRIYRWEDDQRTTPVVLLEVPKNEVRKIVIDPKGNIFAALNSEVIAQRIVSPLGALLKEASSSSEAAKEGSDSSNSSSRLIKPSIPSGKSAVYLVDYEGFVRSLWTVSEAPVHDMVYDGERNSVLIAAGDKGKIFRLDERGQYWVVSSVEDEQVFAIEPAEKHFYLATVGPVSAYRFGKELADEGEYLSPALDAGASVRWGTLRRKGGGVEEIKIETRSGNTAEPDETWYGWTPIKWDDGPNDGRIQSSVARYIQWKAQFKAAGQANSSSDLDLVELFYIPANESPRIKEVTIKKAEPTPSKQPGKTPPSSKSSKENGEDGEEVDVNENSNFKRIEIIWQVEDPNDDPLESAIYFKGEDEKTWKLIKDELRQTKYVFGTGALPDGAYRIKAVVTDRPGNFEPNVREDELISDQFVIDHTSPEIGKIKSSIKQGEKGRWHIEVAISDETSQIANAKYNIDGQELNLLLPRDGLFDNRTEDLEFDTETLEGDEHILGLVVTDREGNSSVARAILRP